MHQYVKSATLIKKGDMERRSSQFQAPEFLKNTDGIMKKF
jgi:hypothetical protein